MLTSNPVGQACLYMCPAVISLESTSPPVTHAPGVAHVCIRPVVVLNSSKPVLFKPLGACWAGYWNTRRTSLTLSCITSMSCFNMSCRSPASLEPACTKLWEQQVSHAGQKPGLAHIPQCDMMVGSENNMSVEYTCKYQHGQAVSTISASQCRDCERLHCLC